MQEFLHASASSSKTRSWIRSCRDDQRCSLWPTAIYATKLKTAPLLLPPATPQAWTTWSPGFGILVCLKIASTISSATWRVRYGRKTGVALDLMAGIMAPGEIMNIFDCALWTTWVEETDDAVEPWLIQQRGNGARRWDWAWWTRRWRQRKAEGVKEITAVE